MPKSTNEIAITKALIDSWIVQIHRRYYIVKSGRWRKKIIPYAVFLPVENSNYSVFVSQSYIENKISEPAYSAYIRLMKSDDWSKAA